MADPPPTRCPNAGRHWFTMWGQVGHLSPTCVRCGAPNPKFDPTAPVCCDQHAPAFHQITDRHFGVTRAGTEPEMAKVLSECAIRISRAGAADLTSSEIELVGSLGTLMRTIAANMMRDRATLDG